MKAPLKISITTSDRPAPQAPSGVREWQIEAAKFCRDNTTSTAQHQRMMALLLAMGEKL